MAKKKSVKNIVKPKKPPVLEHLPISAEERLETLIFFTRRAIDGRGGDEFFINQLARLEKELEDLRNGTT